VEFLLRSEGPISADSGDRHTIPTGGGKQLLQCLGGWAAELNISGTYQVIGI
jgi:hypothetical protein